jgi:excisionase family DNA binding protein
VTEPLAVDIAQAAGLLGVSANLLRTKVDRHEVPHFRIGDRLLFSIEALRQWSTDRALAAVENEDGQAPQPRLTVREGGRRATTTGRRSTRA